MPGNANYPSCRVLGLAQPSPENKALMDTRKSVKSSRVTTTTALARAISRIAQSDGDYPTAIPALSLHRRKIPTEPMHCICGLGLGIVAQGGKQVMLDGEVMGYGPRQSVLTTIDLPVVAHVTRASAREPFLGMMLTIEAHSIVQLAADIELTPMRKDQGYRSLSIETLDAALLDALVRLLALLEEPALLPQLAPLIQQEITLRLLVGPHGPCLRQLASAGSPGRQIAKTVAWLKQHYAQSVNVEELAVRAHMSPSTFRQHFRAITGVSPLPYRKQLRLHEARQLMLNQDLDAGNASGRVGYESASQFSREYSRLFGAPPQRDIRRMRVDQPSSNRSDRDAAPV
jgi:AraC-like DNA-binding protein